MSARSALAARGDADLSYGAGRRPTTRTRCFGCPTQIRRADAAKIRLCSGCTRAVGEAYGRRLRAQGITSDPTDRRWSRAWEALRVSMRRGDEALIRELLAEGL